MSQPPKTPVKTGLDAFMATPLKATAPIAQETFATLDKAGTSSTTPGPTS